MSTCNDVYGILDLVAMRYKKEEDPIIEFSLWPHRQKKSKQDCFNPNLIQPELYDDYSICSIEDPYDFVSESIWAENFISEQENLQ